MAYKIISFVGSCLLACIIYMAIWLARKCYDRFKAANDNNIPSWWKKLFFITMTPIIVWPLVFFMSFFAFDNPKNETLTFFIVTAVDAYPVYLLLSNLIAFFVFKKTKSKILSFSVYLIPVVLIFGGYIYMTKGPVPAKYLNNDDYRIFHSTPAKDIAAAIIKDDSATVAHLLKASPGLVDFKDPIHGESLLFLAWDNEKFHSVKALVVAGANPNQTGRFGLALLHHLCEGKRTQGIKPIMPEEYLNMIRFLLDNGADANILEGQPYDLSRKNGEPWTPLNFLCCLGPDSPEAAGLLVKNGADINHPTKDPFNKEVSPVDDASTNNSFKVIKCLIYNGAVLDSLSEARLKSKLAYFQSTKKLENDHKEEIKTIKRVLDSKERE